MLLLNICALILAAILSNIGATDNEKLGIPADIIAKARSARTLEDFQQKFKINLPSSQKISATLPLHYEKDGYFSGNHGIKPAAYLQRSFLNVKFNSQKITIPELAKYNISEDDTFRLITKPEQGEDDRSCRTSDHCVPIPVKAELSKIHYPACVNLSQCFGGCCSTTKTCHPTKTLPVLVKIVPYKYLGDNTLDQEAEFFVQMVEHLECSCDNANPAVPTPEQVQDELDEDVQTVSSCEQNVSCAANKALRNCACECNNVTEKEQCDKNKGTAWSDEKCTCECHATDKCSAGFTFDAKVCGCIPK